MEQIKIAAEWDRIENTLGNDEFWLFIHELDYNKPNRIDFIFDFKNRSMICLFRKKGLILKRLF